MRTGLFRAGLATLAGLVLTACGTSPSSSRSSGEVEPAAAPELHCADVDGPLENASLGEVVKAADIVALGRVVGMKEGVSVDKSAAGYRVYSIEVNDEFSGSETASFEVATMTNLPNGDPICFDGRPDLAVGDEALWFASSLGIVDDVPRYVLANSASVLAFDQSGVVVNQSDDLPLLMEAGELRTRDAIVAAVKNSLR